MMGKESAPRRYVVLFSNRARASAGYPSINSTIIKNMLAHMRGTVKKEEEGEVEGRQNKDVLCRIILKSPCNRVRTRFLTLNSASGAGLSSPTTTDWRVAQGCNHIGIHFRRKRSLMMAMEFRSKMTALNKLLGRRRVRRCGIGVKSEEVGKRRAACFKNLLESQCHGGTSSVLG
jgi:hypothetical protein